MNPPQTADVVIVGGGPAGATAAISLARSGVSALLLESRGGVSQKTVETIHPTVNLVLHELGVQSRFCEQRHRLSEGILSIWGSDEAKVNDFFYSRQGHGWIVDRAQFDEMLLECGSKAGARVMVGARIVAFKRINRTEWEVTFVHSGSVHCVTARYLVDATGRNGGTFGGYLPRRLVHDRLIGVRQLFAASVPVSYTLIEAVEEGWFFSTSLRDHELTVIYFTDADIYAKGRIRRPCYLAHALCKASHTSSRIKKIEPIGMPMIVSAATSRRPEVMGEGWISVGDAAQSFDPLSSLGIVKAIDSAVRACTTATSALQQTENTSYQDWSNDVFRQYWRNRAMFYGAEKRWPDSVFWSRRHEVKSGSPQRPRLQNGIWEDFSYF